MTDCHPIGYRLPTIRNGKKLGVLKKNASFQVLKVFKGYFLGGFVFFWFSV